MSKEIVVLFSAKLRPDADEDSYEALNARLESLVREVPGFIDVTDYRSEDGEEIGLVRFASAEALRAWATHPEHVAAQQRGREEFYESYRIQIASVERESVFPGG
jgi:heme-degrading monooxygenase HmoA